MGLGYLEGPVGLSHAPILYLGYGHDLMERNLLSGGKGEQQAKLGLKERERFSWQGNSTTLHNSRRSRLGRKTKIRGG